MRILRPQELVLAVLLLGVGSTARAEAPAQRAKSSLTLNGRVLSSDGSPAAGAILSLSEREVLEPQSIKAGLDGRFQFAGEFVSDLNLLASSPDETQQAMLCIPAVLARVQLVQLVELKLAPAREFAVTVRSAGNPVKGAEVVVVGTVCRIRKLTDEKGETRFLLPADERLSSVAAWHSKLGAAGKIDYVAGMPGKSAELNLVAPRPHTIRVLDDHQQPVPDFKLGLNVGLEGREDDIQWLPAVDLKGGQVVTDASGVATIPWFPAEKAKYVSPAFRGGSWKIDKVDQEKVPHGITTVHVRRTAIVKGQLKMPGGTSAEGILVTGIGFGPGNNGHFAVARAAADGSFEIEIAPNHGYALRIADSYWGSDGWDGMIVADERGKPAAISMDVYPATPVAIRVTHGPEHEPVANGYIYLRSDTPFSWTDAEGKKRLARAGGSSMLWTDSKGEIHMGVSRGKNSIRLSLGNWQEEKTIDVQAGEKQIVDFYRPWLTRRQLPGRLMQNGSPRTTSPTMIVSAGNSGRDPETTFVHPEVREDGSFIVKIDAPNLVVVALDSKERLSGFSRAGSSTENIEVALAPAASFGGVVVDTSGKPLDGASVELVVEGTRVPAAEKQITDAQGGFQFDTVATQVPVKLQVSMTKNGPVIHHDRTRFFLPEEVREKTRIVVATGNSAGVEANVKSLAERVQYMTRTARLAGMRGLVVLQGDSTEDVSKLTEQLQDDELVPEVLGFLPMVVSEKVLMSETAVLKELGWQLPKSGEIVLIALEGNQKQIASERIVAGNSDEAFKLGAAFVKQHAPAPRDAKALLAAAQEEAKATGRRVWFVEGGPRCGPCFKLARWMDDQHSLLEKDYVLVKVSDMDKSAEEVMRLHNKPERTGIPWMAITEPGGTILATSDGPLGNIGFPGTIEGTRHLREMLRRTARKLTANEQDQLAASLTQPEL